MRYFFDVEDGVDEIQDEVGLVLDCLEAAKAQAFLSLAEMAKSGLEQREQRVVAIRLRDDTGQVVLKAARTLAAEQVQES